MAPEPTSSAASDSDEQSELSGADDRTFTTYIFSDKGTTLPHYLHEEDVEEEDTVEVNQLDKFLRKEADELPSLTNAQRRQKLSIAQLQTIFDGYRARIITNTLETYLLFLSWASHISDIEDEAERVKQEEALQDFIRDVEHVTDKASKGSLSAVGQRVIVAAFIWLNANVFNWWNEHRGRVSVKMIASCTVKAINDPFLLGRLFRLLMQNKHQTKAEVNQLAKEVVDEDVIAAWDISGGELEYHVFHSDDWVEGDDNDQQLAARLKHGTRRRWVKAATLRQHVHWAEACDTMEKVIRALTIISIGTIAKKTGGVDKFEVKFSNKEVLWLSHDDIRRVNVKQWTQALDEEDAPQVEEKDEEKKDAPQPIPERQKVIEMEEKLKEEQRLRMQEHELRVQAEKRLQLLLEERDKKRAEQLRLQRLQQRDKTKETAQLLKRLSELSARMDNGLRQEVLQLVRALQGKRALQPAEESKEAPQLPEAAEEAKEQPAASPSSPDHAAEDDAAESDAEEAKEQPAASTSSPDNAAEDDAEDDAAEEDAAAEDDAAEPSAPPLATGGKRKPATGKAKAGKKQRR